MPRFVSFFKEAVTATTGARGVFTNICTFVAKTIDAYLGKSVIRHYQDRGQDQSEGEVDKTTRRRQVKWSFHVPVPVPVQCSGRLDYFALMQDARDDFHITFKFGSARLKSHVLI